MSLFTGLGEHDSVTRSVCGVRRQLRWDGKHSSPQHQCLVFDRLRGPVENKVGLLASGSSSEEAGWV